jgi:hypothetical protein
MADDRGRKARHAFQNSENPGCLPKQGKWGSKLREKLTKQSLKRSHQRLIVERLTLLPLVARV